MKKACMFLLFIFMPVLSFADSPPSADKNISCGDKEVMGKIENVILLEKNLTLPAKLDTGAAVSSLSAENVEIFEKNNKTWVRFTIPKVDQGKKMVFEEPLIRYTNILNRSEENASKTDAQKYSKRPVISLQICFGNQKKETLFNLTDRSQFQYPLLIGAEALKDFKVLVDVGRTNLSTGDCSH
jgi:hypothetical protein